MVKYILLIAGILLALFSLATVSRYIGDYAVLTEYGRGYVWGKIILLAIGIILIVLGIRKKRK